MHDKADNYTQNPFYFLFATEAYLSAISDFFDLCLHWLSVVRGSVYNSGNATKKPKRLLSFAGKFFVPCFLQK